MNSLNEFELKYIANIQKTEAMNETQAINIYKKIQDGCNQFGYPITPMEKTSDRYDALIYWFVLNDHFDLLFEMIDLMCVY